MVAGLEAAAVAEFRARGRICSGAMSVDKAELCGSLLTWVGRRQGQRQVSASLFDWEPRPWLGPLFCPGV